MSTTESCKDSYEEQLRQLFNSCDGEQCGFLDRSQLYELSEKLQLDEDQTGYIVDNLICDQFSKVNFEEFKEVFVSLLTQSQLFNTSTNNYSNLENNRTNLTVTELNNSTTTTTNIKMNTYHQDDELNTNRKQNSRTNQTNQTNRRCKKSKKSTNKFESSFDKQFDTSFKENDNNQENSTKHLNQNKNKVINKKLTSTNLNNKNKTTTINLDKDHHNRKQQNLNDRLNQKQQQNNKKMRNSSSGTEEGYSSLDDCGSTASSQSICTIAESPDLVLLNDEDKNEKLNINYILNNSQNSTNKNESVTDELSDRSTVSSTTELNITNTTADDYQNDELHQKEQLDNIEQSTEQYLSSIWSELNVGREGYLTLNELFIVCEHTLGKIDEDLVKQLFDRLDEDKDGKVSFDELLKQLSSNLTNNNTSASLNDNNNDNLNDYQLDNKRDSDKLLEQKMNTDYETSVNSNNLNLELSPYTTTTTTGNYKNYFTTTPSPTNDENKLFKDNPNLDSVDNISESYYSLDSKLHIQPSSSHSTKHQRTNSFTTNSDCLNVPSINSNQQQQQQKLTDNSLSSFNCLNNQSKSDYDFISNTNNNNNNIFYSKRTNSIDQTNYQQQHCKNCIQNNCNNCNNSSSSKLINNSSIVNSSLTINQSSSNETKTVNQTLSSNKNLNTNLSSIDQQNNENLGVVENLSELNKKCDKVNCCSSNCCCYKKRDELTIGQGDIFNKQHRNSVNDKFSNTNLSSRFSSSSNVSTPEQLLNSMHHQFNSSHLSYHQTLNNKEHHHLDHLSQQQQQTELNEDDFCNLNGFGNLLSLDPFSYGYIKISNLLNLWENQLGICNAKLVLEEMGLSSKVNRIQNTEFLTMLEDALRCSIPYSTNRDLFHAVFATIKNEYRVLRQNYDQVKEERDKLRTSIMEVNNRAALLAAEGSMEKKYNEQLKYLQDEIQNEREIVNMQMTRLRGDCEQQVQHMQQINVKCKEYCSQLEQENKRLDKELQECSNQLQEVNKCNNEIQRELQDAIAIKKKLTELESMQSLLREREYDSLMAKMDLKLKENKVLQDKNDELQMELEQLKEQLSTIAKQENNKRRNRRNNSSEEEETDLINYDSNLNSLNKLFSINLPITRRPSQSFYAVN